MPARCIQSVILKRCKGCLHAAYKVLFLKGARGACTLHTKCYAMLARERKKSHGWTHVQMLDIVQGVGWHLLFMTATCTFEWLLEQTGIWLLVYKERQRWGGIYFLWLRRVLWVTVRTDGNLVTSLQRETELMSASGTCESATSSKVCL